MGEKDNWWKVNGGERNVESHKEHGQGEPRLSFIIETFKRVKVSKVGEVGGQAKATLYKLLHMLQGSKADSI